MAFVQQVPRGAAIGRGGGAMGVGRPACRPEWTPVRLAHSTPSPRPIPLPLRHLTRVAAAIAIAVPALPRWDTASPLLSPPPSQSPAVRVSGMMSVPIQRLLESH